MCVCAVHPSLVTCVTVLYAPSLDLSPVGSSTHVAATAMQGRHGNEKSEKAWPGPPKATFPSHRPQDGRRDLQLPFSAGTDDARDDGSQVHAWPYVSSLQLRAQLRHGCVQQRQARGALTDCLV